MRPSKFTSNQLLPIRRIISKLPVFLGISIFWIMCSKSDSAKTPDSVKNNIDTVKSIQTPVQEDTIIDNRTTQQMWNDFYAAKNSADSALIKENYTVAKDYLKKAAFHAMEVSRDDIAAWQLNNIGYYSIEEFKQRTDYINRMRTIENMRRGPQKNIYVKETKEIFKKHLPGLLNATSFLEDAYDLDKDFNDNDRTEKIYSNLAYIDWVRNFTEK